MSNVSTETASTDTSTDAGTETKPEVDFSAFTDAANKAVTSGDFSEAVAAYQAQDRAGKAAITRSVQTTMKDLMLAGNTDAALVWVQIDVALKSKPASEKKAREPKAPVDQTPLAVERILALHLAQTVALDNLPEGVDRSAVTKAVKAGTGDALAEVAQLVAHKAADDDTDAPEVSAVAQRAFRLAFQGATKKSGGSGNGSTYSGPRRSIGKHIAEALAQHDAGTFLSVSDLRAFTSGEYGEDSPSAGAISASLKAGNLPEGIRAAQGAEFDQKDVLGAVRTA